MSNRQPSLSKLELIGAWTGLWTAPKDVDVPPVPYRKLALGALAAVVVIGGLLALIIPLVQHGKKVGAAERAKEDARAVAALAARLRVDQRVHRAPFSASPVASLQAAITADARARVAAGKLEGPIVGTKCQPSGRSVEIYPRSGVFHCFVTSENIQGEGKDVLGTGYPFIATIYYGKHQLVWCKLNPQPGEKTRGKGLARVTVSKACAGKLSALL
jgi:type II secretory pathway pseudopilin PulG